MATLHGFSKSGEQAVVRYWTAIMRHDPALGAHFNHAVTRMQYGGCGHHDSVACVYAHRPREIFLAHPPEYTSAGEVVRLMMHEARHWQQNAFGQWFMFGHQCSDQHCNNRDEFLRDPVYAADVALQPRINNALRADGIDPALPWVAPLGVIPRASTPADAIQVVAVAAVVVLGVFAAINLGRA